jgi:hypothetical protein
MIDCGLEDGPRRRCKDSDVANEATETEGRERSSKEAPAVEAGENKRLRGRDLLCALQNRGDVTRVLILSPSLSYHHDHIAPTLTQSLDRGA